MVLTTPTLPKIRETTMTYREYITAIATRFNATETDIDVLLANQSALIPDPTAAVEPTLAKRALCAEFATLIPLANVSEGGYSISWNIEALKIWYHATCNELGITPADKPRLKNRSNIW